MRTVVVLIIIPAVLMIACSKKAEMVETSDSRVTGTVEHYRDFTSQFVDPRHVDVWLPASYAEHTERRYPVIYMHDGQNLFDPGTSFIGVDWGMDEVMTRLIEEKRVPQAIVVGIWNTPKRVAEYMPQKPLEQFMSSVQQNEFIEKNGEPISDLYLRFIVYELKPFIDLTYRTMSGREYTSIMGSSMGALISLYALCEYPQFFGGAGCLSTHWPAGDGVMLSYLKEFLPDAQMHKIYFDFGTETLDAGYEPFQMEADKIMAENGYTVEKNWMTRKFQGDEHSERAWKKRVHIPLQFLLGSED
jgi:predicted alpha/beta superfamily hydrolase